MSTIIDKKRKITSIAAVLCANIFDSDSSEESDCEEKGERRKIPKNEGFSEVTVHRFFDKEFQRHFRLRRSTFHSLLVELKDNISNENSIREGRSTVSAEKQLQMTMWLLGNQESYRSVADRFGVCQQACWQSVFMVVEQLLQLNFNKGIIKWPTTMDMESVIEKFLTASRFPGILGAIDGSHIPIKAPHANPAAYVNRKGFHSVVLQGICSYDMKFLDCYAGEVGSVHDARVFKRSDFYKRMTTQRDMFPLDSHLVGDLAYPLMSNVMVGFKDNEHLSESERSFNKQLSSARCSIERSFALLKGRFRRLKYLDMTRIDLIPRVISACCILHNICLMSNDFFEDLEVHTIVSDNVNDYQEETMDSVAKLERKVAVDKRKRLMLALH